MTYGSMHRLAFEKVELLTEQSSKRPAANERDFQRPLINATIARATKVLGNKDKALRWMGTPVRGLGFATPISLLSTSKGAQSVDDILTQMEHGVW